jgi:parallel beta-helix repeat protein
MIKKIVLLFLCVIICTNINSQTCYVDAEAGNDSYDGLSSSTAWQTLAKLNSASVKAGSQVLLKRGCEWRGQLIVPADNITYLAYGEGNKPVINASRVISGWTKHSGSIYKATVPFEVKAVYCDGKYQELAHWPDDDWLLTDEKSTSSDYIIDNNLSAPGGIIGAGIVIRTHEHWLVNSTVNSYSNNRVGFEMTNSTATLNSQYYFCNKLWMLNSPGEWFYDQDNQMLYLWPEPGDDPNLKTIEVPEFDYGISIQSRKDVTLENIAVVMARQHGVLAAGTNSSIVFRSLNIKKMRSYGILILDQYSESIVENCDVSFCGLNGIFVKNGKNCDVKDNIIHDIGMAGKFPDQNSNAGIQFANIQNLNIVGNRISRISKGGIIGSSSMAIIRNNVVDSVMLRFNDNGGIYLWGPDTRGSQIIGNIVTNSIGNPRPGSWGEFGQGIYLDDRSNNVKVVGNTVVNAVHGYLIHDAFYNEVSGNVAYNCRAGSYYILEDTIAGTKRGETTQNIIRKNVFVGNITKPLARLDGSLGYFDFGTYDQNHFYNVASDWVGRVSTPSLSGNYSINDWRNITRQDHNSVDANTYYHYEPFAVINEDTNLIANSTFDSNINKWSKWSPGGATTISWSNEEGLDEGCLKTVNTDPSGVYGQAFSGGFSLIKDSTYYLSVEMKAPALTNVQLIVRLNEDTYESYASQNFTITPERKKYKMYFSAPKTVSNASFVIHFKGPAELFLDNVVLAQAEVKVNDLSKATNLLVNDHAKKQNYALGSVPYCDITGKTVKGSVTLDPYSSMVLLPSYNNGDCECNNWETHETAPGDCKEGERGANYGKFTETEIIDDFILQVQPNSKNSVIVSWNPACITIANKTAFCLAYKKGGIVTRIDESGIDTLMYNLTAAKDTISMGISNEVATYYFTAFVLNTDKKFTIANGNAITSVVVGEPVMPANPCILGGNSIDSAAIAVFWKVKTINGFVFDSIGVWYSELGYPVSAYDSGTIKAGAWNLKTTADTVTNLKADKLYYFSIFGRDTAGNWSKTSDSAKVQIRTRKPGGGTNGWQVILKGSEQTSFFSDSLTMWGDELLTIGGDELVNPYTDTVDRWSMPVLNGFIVMGPSFIFRNGNGSTNLRVNFALSPSEVVAPYSLADIRIYRFNVNTNAWRLDTAALTYNIPDNKINFSTSDLRYPFAIMIDTVAPYLKSFTTDVATSFQIADPICDTFTIKDNIENPVIKLLAAPGANTLTDISHFVTALKNETDIRLVTTIPAYVADQASGLRSILTVSDGRKTDTINLSRKIMRIGTNCDDTTIAPMEWTPLSVTGTPLKNSLFKVMSHSLSRDSFVYDIKHQRVVRWIPDKSNNSAKDKWVEYRSADSSSFKFDPGTTLWIKSAKSMKLSYDTAIIPALIDTFNLELKKGEWTDFSLPYNFDIYAGDIIDATKSKDTDISGIELYEWTKSGTTYITKALYLSGIEATSDPRTILKAGGAFSVYNSCDHDIVLRIPPVCIPVSATGRVGSLAKNAALLQQWSVKLRFNNDKGAELSSIYCTSLPENGKPRFYKSAPSFGNIYAGVIDQKSGKQYGHAATGNSGNGGAAFIITCENRSDQASFVRAAIEKTSGLPPETQALLYFGGNITDINHTGSYELSISQGQRTTGYLIVGNVDYISRFITKLNSEFSFRPLTMNHSLLLRYVFPLDVKKITISIFDLKGRSVYRNVLTQGARAGKGLFRVDKRFASGYYIIQMKIETIGVEKTSVLNRQWVMVK